jgi:hypothetical protein
MVMITSWNEWNEDTAIEPLVTRRPPPATRASAGSTQGYLRRPRDASLEAVRDKVVAAVG